jgi:hypothetical protein
MHDTVIQDQLKITKIVRIHMQECPRFRELVEAALNEDKIAVGPKEPQQHPHTLTTTDTNFGQINGGDMK